VATASAQVKLSAENGGKCKAADGREDSALGRASTENSSSPVYLAGTILGASSGKGKNNQMNDSI